MCSYVPDLCMVLILQELLLNLFLSWGFPNWSVSCYSMVWDSAGEGNSACWPFDRDEEDLLVRPLVPPPWSVLELSVLPPP